MRFPLAFAVFLSTTLTAAAGDAAARNVLGFSPDGKIFVFEQYSMEYEEEASFSEFVFVETLKDRYLPGTPIRVRVTGDDGLDEGKARERAAAKAAPLVGKFTVADKGTHFPGKPSIALDEIGIYQTAGEPLAAAQDIELPGGRKASLALATRGLGTAVCKTARGVNSKYEVKGLTLTLTLDGKKIVLQDDRKLPANRRCVTDYGIAEAWLHTADDKALTLAVLVEVVDNDDSHAGPNRRFMAVTRRLPAK